MKPIQLAVAAFIIDPKDESTFLTVKRPINANSLPGVWGLPAVTLTEGETVIEGLHRIGTEKLATTIEPLEFIGVTSDDRGGYILILTDIKAKVIGVPPDVESAQTESTKYEKQQWTSEKIILKEAAQKGSLCSQIILDREGIKY